MIIDKYTRTTEKRNGKGKYTSGMQHEGFWCLRLLLIIIVMVIYKTGLDLSTLGSMWREAYYSEWREDFRSVASRRVNNT